jgi:hypothetical protein
MRRALFIGLTLLVSVSVLVGVRARYQRVRFQQAVARAAATADEAKPSAPIPQDATAEAKASAPIPQDAAAEAKPSAPIPQDAAAIEKHRHDLLAWNRRTLQEAYDRVGKKDPRWDDPARKTLDLAARMFSREVDPQVTFSDVYSAAKAAVEAGCDDPMLLYVYARTSVGANYPGPKEARRRAQAAARGLATSRYPAFRRAVALRFSGMEALAGRNVGNANRKEAERDFDAALALLEESVASDEHNEFWEANWLDTLIEVTRGFRTLDVPAEAAYERVDAGLARVSGAKFLRLIYRGSFWFGYGWEARTQAFAPAVPETGFDTLEKRLAIAREAYQEAWKIQLGSAAVAREFLEIDKAVGGDRATMELWFERAMKADGDDRTACWSKLDWLDPKWHGSAEEMLAFGRACRDTKNSRTGITLLVADAHWRIACMPGENQNKYLALPEVWADIQSVYDEYLKHFPVDDLARSKFATFCHLSAHYREAEVQYVALGNHLTQWSEFPFVPLNQLKQGRERNAKIVLGKEGRITFPGWHFVGGTNDDGEWHVNIPVGAPHQEKPGILGADASHVFNCSADGITYGVRVLNLPPALRNDSPERVLDAARSVVAKERGAQPRNLRDTLLAARPAQEYDVDLPGPKPMQLRVKTIVIGTWLYELSVMASKSDVTGSAAREFFDSFAFQPVG